MNILLISQCDKRALSESRRILDQFAERRGERTWQTPITQAGLDTLRKLLRKSARKNTAVACHWLRGVDHSELLWIVGDARRFNAEGTVPTNSTARDVRRRHDENDWHSAEDIRLLAQLAALLHDLGKATHAFQDRLRGRLNERNRYRHEWVSLRMFQAFVADDDDATWLHRLADARNSDEQRWLATDRYQRDGLDARDSAPFPQLPPLAAAVAWLILSHHRLPMVPVKRDNGQQDWLGKRSSGFRWNWLETPLAAIGHDWNEIRAPAAATAQIQRYWTPAGPLPVVEQRWRLQAARVAGRLLQRHSQRHALDSHTVDAAEAGHLGADTPVIVSVPVDKSATDNPYLDNPYVMHLARLSLMLADHHYSSLCRDSPLRVDTDGSDGHGIFANTDGEGGLKQTLGEHLLGVARDAGLIAHALPGFERHLPRLANHRGLRKRSANPAFSWQDNAADAAVSLRENAGEHGAFIINMASTGCGKTLANARILYALADPQHGLRVSYALGLRTLTLQTGRSYRRDLHLDEDELAILVGGSASRALFDYYERQAEARGSASTQTLIEEDSHVLYEGAIADHPLLSRALADAEIRKLLSAPMLVCTVDHLVPATEALRGGRQIAPMLRLMSADLVLDELDDYDLKDLPALTRLVHWAGMLGTRIVLSSATLPPALVEGMFLAYRAGRCQYRRNRGQPRDRHAQQIDVPCLWVDEFDVQVGHCRDSATFVGQHARFIDKRVSKLAQARPLRRAELIPLDIDKGLPRAVLHAQLAAPVRAACLRLHRNHAQSDPLSGKRVSFGIVRLANIGPLFDLAQALFALGAPEHTRIHLCVYHARFPLLQRSAIERQLDAAFDRRGDGQAVYRLPAVRALLDAHPEREHLFVVLASPVCEVGRDWDADWAVAEPSSMRALIQLAGRVQRHRGQPAATPNLLLFMRNVRSLLGLTLDNGDPAPVFIAPGFERHDKTHRFCLYTHRLDRLLLPEEYQTLTALPRIRPRADADLSSRERLVDLEHARIAACMLPRQRLAAAWATPASDTIRCDEAAWCWQYPQAALTGVLPQQQPFREDTTAKVTLVLLPDPEREYLRLHRIVDDPERRGRSLYVPIDEELRHDLALTLGERIGPWTATEPMALLAEQADHLDRPLRACAERLMTVEVPHSERGWRYHLWLGLERDQ